MYEKSNDSKRMVTPVINCYGLLITVQVSFKDITLSNVWRREQFWNFCVLKTVHLSDHVLELFVSLLEVDAMNIFRCAVFTEEKCQLRSYGL